MAAPDPRAGPVADAFAELGGKVSWDDLRAFLAVAVHGSMNRAGAVLRESQPTIGRRMARLEQVLDLALLERGVNAVSLTEAGHALLRAISPMAGAVGEIGPVIAGYRARDNTPIRLTATTSVAMFLTQNLPALQAAIAPRGLIILPSRRPFDLARGEADIALRMRALPKSPHYLARKLGRIGFSLYGISRDPALPVILPSGDETVSRQFALANMALGDRTTGPEIDEMPLRYQAITAGIGIGTLPCWIGDSDPRLVRIFAAPEFRMAEDVFLIRLARSRTDPSIESLAEALTALFRASRRALAG